MIVISLKIMRTKASQLHDKSQNIEIRNQNKRTWDWHWAWFRVGQLKHEVLSLDFSLDVKDF